MVGVVILYDHVHPVGAFAKSSSIDVSNTRFICRPSYLGILGQNTEFISHTCTVKKTLLFTQFYEKQMTATDKPLLKFQPFIYNIRQYR